jgi:hypothetical protein
MKAALWRSALLLLLGAAAATPTATASEEAVLRQLQRRQLTGLVGGKPAKPERIVKLEPRVRKDATRVQLRFGPYTLPALHRDVRRVRGGQAAWTLMAGREPRRAPRRRWTRMGSSCR